MALFALATSGVACADNAGIFTEDGRTPTQPDSVRFAHDGTLELKPSQVESIEILTSPGAALGVLILGDGFDASLDRSTVQAAEDGFAAVVLTAPSQPATFRLRAQLGEISAELPVSVSELGFADLRVVPKYTGVRDVDGWVADVVVGSSCEEVLAKLPQHPGGLRSSAPFGSSPIVESVPVGPKVVAAIHTKVPSTGPVTSVVVAAGCTEIALETAGKTAEVVVDVLDRPMALEDAVLDVSLDFAPDPTGYEQILQAGTLAVANAAFPPGYPMSQLLLDHIEAALDPGDLAAFQEHRQASQLDTNISTIVEGFDANAWCLSLGHEGTTAALADAGTDTSTIEGRLTGNSYDPLTASLSLENWSGGSADALGVPAPLSVTWSARPGDGIEVIGSIPFSGTRLAGHWMHVSAMALYGPSATVSSALAGDLNCEAVGAQIAGFGTCDAACGTALCEDAVASLWETGLDADMTGVTTISLTAEATVDGGLVPIAFEGTWAGTLTALGKSGNVAGAAVGESPPPN